MNKLKLQINGNENFEIRNKTESDVLKSILLINQKSKTVHFIRNVTQNIFEPDENMCWIIYKQSEINFFENSEIQKLKNYEFFFYDKKNETNKMECRILSFILNIKNVK